MVRINMVRLAGEFFFVDVFDNGEGRIWKIEPAQGCSVNVDNDSVNDVVCELDELRRTADRVFWFQEASRGEQAAVQTNEQDEDEDED